MSEADWSGSGSSWPGASGPGTPPRLPHRRVRLVIEVVLLLAVGLGVYFGFVHQNGPKPLKLALVTWTEDPFWEPLLRGATDYAKKSNTDLTIVKCKPTVDDQTGHLRQLLDAGIQGIAVSPNDATAEKAILDEATRKIPVVTFDTDAPETKRRRFVSIDNYAAGRFAAAELAEAMPDGGPVLISVGSVTQQHGRDRRQGVIDELLGRGVDRERAADPLDAPIKGPKFTIVATALDGGDPAKAVESITAALKAHPEIKGVVGLFSYSAPAALDAAKKLGRTEPLTAVGFDASDETQAALAAGTIHSSVLQESYRAGYEAIEVLADEARGIPHGPAELSPVLNVGTRIITGKDLDLLRKSGAIGPVAAGKSNGPTTP